MCKVSRYLFKCLFNFKSRCFSTCMQYMSAQYSRKPKESMGSPGTGVTNSCRQHTVLGIKPRSSQRAAVLLTTELYLQPWKRCFNINYLQPLYFSKCFLLRPDFPARPSAPSLAPSQFAICQQLPGASNKDLSSGFGFSQHDSWVLRVSYSKKKNFKYHTSQDAYDLASAVPRNGILLVK